MKKIYTHPDIDAATGNALRKFEQECHALSSHQQTLIRDFLEHDILEYRTFLSDFEQKVSTRHDIQEAWCRELKTASDTVVQKGEDLTTTLDNRIFEKRLRHVFRALISPWPYTSIIMDKGLKKHRGYPGDYEMMNYVYNNSICSDTLLGKYFDVYFLRNAYSDAVRGRKNLMRDLLVTKVEHAGGLRILNIPCGPSRDIKEFLTTPHRRSDFEIMGIDHDAEALAFSRQSLTDSPQADRVTFRQGDILDYVRNPARARAALGLFDMIYSIGIADYFPDKLLQKFIYCLYEILKPGGTLIIAFKITTRDPFAPLPPKWFCDWVFVPRSLEESRTVLEASGIASFTKQRETWEESGRICFLEYKKG